MTMSNELLKGCKRPEDMLGAGPDGFDRENEAPPPVSDPPPFSTPCGFLRLLMTGPTPCLENRSRMTAGQTHPSRVGT